MAKMSTRQNGMLENRCCISEWKAMLYQQQRPFWSGHGGRLKPMSKKIIAVAKLIKYSVNEGSVAHMQASSTCLGRLGWPKEGPSASSWGSPTQRKAFAGAEVYHKRLTMVAGAWEPFADVLLPGNVAYFICSERLLQNACKSGNDFRLPRPR